ncbi:MAG: V-type ATP synthase subunit E [Firmicutes bacterium]|nr:V-type ATP synthase subunit E [Bacillota bacterium]
MNGIEKITAQIQKDVQSEIDALLKQAQEESAAIQADYKAKAAALQQDILAKGQQAAEERIERQTRAAELEARKLLLQTKQEKIDDSFRRAHKKLLALKGEERINLNARLIAFGSRSGKETIFMNDDDLESIGPQVIAKANKLVKGASFTLSEKPRDISGGLIISAGDVEVNCAYDTILRIMRDELAGDVAKVLFS